jgi:hypothetical protein
MKNKFSNGRLSYFSTPRIHGNVLAWVEPASASERSKRVIENILRWEDDGGLIIEVAKPIMSLRLDQTIFKNEEVKRLST